MNNMTDKMTDTCQNVKKHIWLAVNDDGSKVLIECERLIRFYPDKYLDKFSKYHKDFENPISYNDYTSKCPIWIPYFDKDISYRSKVLASKRLDFPPESDIDIKLSGRKMNFDDEPIIVE